MSDSVIVLVIAAVWLGAIAFAYCICAAAGKPTPPPSSGKEARSPALHPSGPDGTTDRRAATQARAGLHRDPAPCARLARSNDRRPGTSPPEAP